MTPSHKFKLSQLSPTQLWLYRIINKVDPATSSDSIETNWMPAEAIDMIMTGGNYADYFSQWTQKLMEITAQAEEALFKPNNISLILRMMDIGNPAGLAIVPHNMIIINPWYLLAFPEDVIKKTLPHELTHIICAHEYGSGDHDDNFKEMLWKTFKVKFENFEEIFSVNRDAIVNSTVTDMFGLLKVTKFMLD